MIDENVRCMGDGCNDRDECMRYINRHSGQVLLRTMAPSFWEPCEHIIRRQHEEPERG